MSGNNWTKEQLEAITGSGCNMLVAAAAGAGKTAVLVERIIRKITDDTNPIDIDRLLIVTFTKASATEMRERIGEAISKELDKTPDSKRLQRQLMLLNRASITTIHSFCLEVIRNNFHCIDLDPAFRISDETEAVLMKLEVLEELFEDKYEDENQDPDFLRLVESYSGSKDDKLLQDMVLNTYEFVQSYPWPEKWLYEKTQAFNLSGDMDFGHTVWAKVLLESIQIELKGLIDTLCRAVAIIKRAEGLDGYLPAFITDVNNISHILKLCENAGACIDLEEPCDFNTWDRVYYAFINLDFDKLGRCGKDVDKDAQEQVRELREEVKKRFRKIRDDIFTENSSQLVNGLRELFPLMRCLSDLVMEFARRYVKKKREKSLLDFNDLEHLCLEILTTEDAQGNVIPSQVAYEYRERFVEILVDEYQDSNLVQEVLLGTISRKETEYPNVFMVGDIKQSIYRFRQAKPELFLQKYNTYQANSDSKNRKVQLYKNFRSREEVIHCVNYIFKQIMSVKVGELDYNEEEALNLGARYENLEDDCGYTGGPAELHLIDMVNSDIQAVTDNNEDNTDNENEELTEVEGEAKAEEDEEPLDVIQTEARLVIQRIKELIKPESSEKTLKIYDKKAKGYRSVEFRDIVILMRSTRNRADIFVEEMGNQGIPAYADSGSGFFRTVEVQVVMSLLEIIDNPMQDIPLLAVLRSPIASFTPEELIDIRLADKESSFYEAMKRLAERGDSKASGKASLFLTNLNRWREKSLYMPTDELIWYLYSDTGYYSYVGAMTSGIQRQANLRILFERARQFEETSYKGLFNYINFINKLKRTSGDMGSAKILGENENVVRIMSIHKSKGLEFPVVILAGCGKQFNLQDMNKSILLHQDMGFGPDYVDHNRRISYPTVPKQALRYRTKIENLSEEMRILYVAFTRAKEKLIITGCIKDIGKTASKWKDAALVKDNKLPHYEMLRAKTYLDWIGPALMRHKDCGVLQDVVSGNKVGTDTYEQADATFGNIYTDSSMWDIKLWRKADFIRSVESQTSIDGVLLNIDEIGDGAHSLYENEISKRLEWNYPFITSSTMPTKISVTELKRYFNAETAEEYAPVSIHTPVLVKKPLFMEEIKGLNSAERGTVMHFVMQHLDFGKVRSREEIELQLVQMVEKELLTAQQAQSVNVNKILTFFKSEIGSRLLMSGKVCREVPFNIEICCRDVYPDITDKIYDDEAVMLQGVIDCYFEEEESIILLDYKTDFVPEQGSELIKKKYKIQIDYYTRALEHITSRKVNGRYIYLFSNGETLKY